MHPCIEEKGREGHAAANHSQKAMSPHGACMALQVFVRLFSSRPTRPPLAHTGAHMPENYKKAKLGLKKRSLATI